MAATARKPPANATGDTWRDDLVCPGIVVSCGVRIARNIANTPFPETLGPDGRRALRDRLFHSILRNAAEGRLDNGRPARWELVDLDSEDEAARRIREERCETSAEMSADPTGRGIAIPEAKGGPDTHLLVRVNDGDHLRFCGIQDGCDLAGLYAAVSGIESAFDGVVADYAFDATYGYLTPAPEDVGTGLRVGVVLHLAGLRETGDLEKVFRALDRLGLEVAGVGGQSPAEGTLFLISSLQTLGEDEGRILERTDSILQDVAVQEDRARMRLVETESLRLADFVSRARGIALNASLLSIPEARELLHAATLAVELGYASHGRRNITPDLDLLLHPEVIRQRLKNPIDDDWIDAMRAGEIRRIYEGLRWH